MAFLRVDDKWSIEFEPEENDMPIAWHRYDKYHSEFEKNNPTTAMFYALLEAWRSNDLH